MCHAFENCLPGRLEMQMKQFESLSELSTRCRLTSLITHLRQVLSEALSQGELYGRLPLRTNLGIPSENPVIIRRLFFRDSHYYLYYYYSYYYRGRASESDLQRFQDGAGGTSSLHGAASDGLWQASPASVASGF